MPCNMKRKAATSLFFFLLEDETSEAEDETITNKTPAQAFTLAFAVGKIPSLLLLSLLGSTKVYVQSLII
jgi:hypothetical protein